MFVSAKLTAATSGAELVPCSADSKLVISGVSVHLDGGTTVNVAVNVGFGANALTNVATGHPGIVPGSGFGESKRYEGGIGEKIYVSTGAPTTGSVQFNITYELHKVINA